MVVSLFAVLLAVVATVQAHSWVQCADYTEENGRYWDVSKCRGYARNYVTKFQYTNPPYGFGQDGGMDHQITDITQVCQTQLDSTSYSSAYPAAAYYPGQKVCLAWPPKNHVSAACVNPNIPDGGTKLYRSGINPTSDPTLSGFNATMVWDFGTNTQVGAGVGFQNCPNFCSNSTTQDKSLCTGCYTVPSDLAQGKYIFLWLWEFNQGQFYATCMDVTISSTVASSAPTSLPHIGPDAYFAALKATTTQDPVSISTTAAATSSHTSSTSGAQAASTLTSGSSTASQAASSASSAANSANGATASNPGTTTTQCNVGSEGCACTVGGSCDTGLSCLSKLCVDAGQNVNPGNSAASLWAYAFTFGALVACL